MFMTNLHFTETIQKFLANLKRSNKEFLADSLYGSDENHEKEKQDYSVEQVNTIIGVPFILSGAEREKVSISTLYG